MALIKCPECGKEISDKAPVCIHCGYPLQEQAAQAAAAGVPESAIAGSAAAAAATAVSGTGRETIKKSEEQLRAEAAEAGFDLASTCPICGTARWAFSRGVLECPVCGHKPLEEEL